MKLDYDQFQDDVREANTQLEIEGSLYQWDLHEEGELTCLELHSDVEEVFDGFRLIGESVETLVSFALAFKEEAVAA